MNRFIFVIGLVSAFTAAAQSPYVSRQGKFQVNEIKGCAPFTVTAETITGCGGGTCVYDFLGDGFGENNPPGDNIFTGIANFTYDTPGTYKLQFCANNCTAGDVDDIEIVVTANTLPDFDIYTCSNNGVQVKVNGTTYNQYVINYNDATGDIVVPAGNNARDTHIFSTTGAKTISVRGRHLVNGTIVAADNCATEAKSFTAVAVMPASAVTNINAINNTALDVLYTLPQNVLGRIDIAVNNNATFQQLRQAYEDTRDTIASINNTSNYYCVRIGSVDACANAVSYAPTVCSIVFNAAANDGFNQLNWNTNSQNVSSYTLSRDANTNYFGGIAPALRTINDNDAGCNLEHCYRLTAIYTGGATAVSLPACVTSFTTQQPPAIVDLSASFVDEAVEVTWEDQIDAEVYSIFKNNNGGSFSLARQQPDLPYTDVNYSLSVPSCYQVSYNDACQNVSDASLVACPVILSATVSADNVIVLSWSDYQGWQNGIVNYQLQKFSASGNLLRDYDLGNATTFTDDTDDIINQTNQVFRYVVVATATDATLGTVNSNTVEVVKKPNLYYPTAFTPDGQGPTDNERFRVFGEYIRDCDMKIFNRWGELVFTSTEIEIGWDGKFRGQEQPDGTYTFLATLTDFSGRIFTRSGSLVLIRKK